MKKLVVLSLLLLSPCAEAMELVPVDIQSKESAFAEASSDRSLKLYTNHKDFYVENENAAYRVANHNVNPLLKQVLQRKVLDKFKEAGYIRVNQLEDGKYELAAKVRGLGGTGPITAGVVNVVVRTGCWLGLMGVGVGINLVTPPGTGTVAIPVAIAQAGGVAGIAAGIESIALQATLATLLLPIPLP